MYKQLLIASLLIISALSASTTLFSASSNSFAIEISNNAGNDNYTDVIVTYTTPTTAISDSYLSSVICVNLEAQTVLTATNNSMKGFSFEITCDAPCSSSAKLTMSEWVGYENLIGTYAASSDDSFATNATISIAYPTDPIFSSDAGASTANNFLASTPANILTMGIPKRGTSANFRCWGKIDYATTVSYKSATIITLNTLVPGNNVTLSNGVTSLSEDSTGCSGAETYQIVTSAILSITALIMMN